LTCNVVVLPLAKYNKVYTNKKKTKAEAAVQCAIVNGVKQQDECG